jgi:hypothetical protein
MSEYVDNLKAALFRAKECAKSLRRAADAIGVDIDAPPQKPPLPDDEDERRAYLRVVRRL